MLLGRLETQPDDRLRRDEFLLRADDTPLGCHRQTQSG